MGATANVKLRGGAFIPRSSLFRGIYGTALPTAELEFSKKKYEYFALFGNVNWSGQKGHSIGLKDPTTINIVTGSFGPKLIHCFSKYNLCYFAVGPTFSGVWLKNNIRFNQTTNKVSKTVFGAVFKVGLTHHITETFCIDFFADYYYQPNNFATKVDLGGLRTGAGLGYCF